MVELFQKGQFGGVADLRRLILHIRLKGQLTNIFYSMHNGTTEFMAHQFKPVMKYIESTTGRLLIADEVGLGKTIEAIYIWKELQARENARRMLIVWIMQPFFCKFRSKQVDRLTPASTVYHSAIGHFARSAWQPRDEVNWPHSGKRLLLSFAC